MSSSPFGVSAASPMHTGEAGRSVAIQTAQAMARGQGECGVCVFFDLGSNKSFVTPGLQEQIKPKVRWSEWLELATFGNTSSKKLGISDVIEFELFSHAGDKSMFQVIKVIMMVVYEITIVTRRAYTKR